MKTRKTTTLQLHLDPNTKVRLRAVAAYRETSVSELVTHWTTMVADDLGLPDPNVDTANPREVPR